MATIGLRDLYRAPITVEESGEEKYGTPVRMAKAISAEMSVEVAEAILYADDGADEVVKEFVARLLYIGVTLLHWPEREVWRMTPYKILALFRIHREFNPDRFKPEEKEADIDDVLGGL